MPVSRENLIFWDLYSTKHYRLVSSTDGISTFFSVKVAVTRYCLPLIPSQLSFHTKFSSNVTDNNVWALK